MRFLGVSLHYLFIFLLSMMVGAELFITEIERDPIGKESEAPGGKSHEYIEIFNYSKDTLNLEGTILTDGIVKDSLIAIEGQKLLLSPGGIALILDPDYLSFISDAPFDSVNITLFTVNHTSLCGGLTSSDGFALVKNDSILASATDTINPLFEGKKLELLSFEGKEQDSTVLELKSLFREGWYREALPSMGSVTGVQKGVFWDVQIEKQSDEVLLSLHTTSFVAQKVTWQVWQGISLISEGLCSILPTDKPFEIALTPSEEPIEIVFFHKGNSFFSDTVDISSIWFPTDAIVITEVNPRQDEWVELYNRSDMPISLNSWQIISSEDTMVIGDISINPKSYQAIPTTITLNNYRDTVMLTSSFGIIDTLGWESGWFDKWSDESVNRVDYTKSGLHKNNLILAKASPNAPSYKVAKSATNPTVSIYPKVFTPNGDGEKDSLYIAITNGVGYRVQITVFDMEGRRLFQKEEIEENLFAWGGEGDGVTPQRGPIFIIMTFEKEGDKRRLRREAILWR